MGKLTGFSTQSQWNKWNRKLQHSVRTQSSASSNVTFDLLLRTLQSWQRPEPVCISNCNCYTASVSPVCGSNGVTYLSACFAGCTKPVSEAAGGFEEEHTVMIRFDYCCRGTAVLMSFPVSFCVLPEPEQLCVYIQQQRGGRGSARKVSQSRLSGSLPHLPVCHLCVQHDRSHGPDSLSHHPDQARRSAHQQRELSTLHLARRSIIVLN